jgi:ribosomal protein S18 acetylase RimI-like enzyme
VSRRIKISFKNGGDYFYLEPFVSGNSPLSFDCAVAEYNEYLLNDALRSKNDHIALTWLLTERATGKVAAYMSLIMDAIRLSFSEKELHNLKYPFKTIPAMKIAKLAVDRSFLENYKGIGTFMIDSAERLAWACNGAFCAARFLTVDADIERSEGVLAFYQKNGFLLNSELYHKNRKTISMRKDLYR